MTFHPPIEESDDPVAGISSPAIGLQTLVPAHGGAASPDDAVSRRTALAVLPGQQRVLEGARAVRPLAALVW